MKIVSGAFLCLVVSVLLVSCLANDYSWLPTPEERKAVTRATFQLPAKSEQCGLSKMSGAKEFFNKDYFQYPENNFTASYQPGDPIIRFFAKDTLLREINVARTNRRDIMTMLDTWGFVKNAALAKDIRTDFFAKHSWDSGVAPAPALQFDENGNVIFPKPSPPVFEWVTEEYEDENGVIQTRRGVKLYEPPSTEQGEDHTERMVAIGLDDHKDAQN